jgi:hypothetical protein
MNRKIGMMPLIASGALGVLLLAGCGKKASESALPPSGTGSGSAESSFHTQLVHGADQAAIRAYLESVHAVKPKKFEVTWSADTVPVSREEALRSLRKVSSDGSTFTFASSESVVSKLQPGKIVWIWGIAIRRIEKVGVIDDVTLIRTQPVPLIEALPKADIEFDTPIDFASAYGISGPGTPPVAASTKSSALARRPVLQPVRLEDPPDSNRGQDSPGAPPGDADSANAFDFVAGTRDGYTGKAAGFEYSLAYNMTGKKLSFELQARKEEESSASGASSEMHRDERHEFFEYVHEQHQAEHEAEKAYERMGEFQVSISKLAAETGFLNSQPSTPQNATAKASNEALQRLYAKDLQQDLNKYHEAEARAKAAEESAKKLAKAGAIARQVFDIISDNLDVRFRARVDLSTATLVAAVKLGMPAANTGSSVAFKDLAAKLDLELVARLGEAGTGGVNIPVAHIPVKFNIPVLIEGIPFVAQIAADFLVKVGLSGKHAAQHFRARFDLNGGGGFTATSESQSNANFNLSGDEPEIEETVASSPGVSGVVLAVQIPRFGFGLGLFDVAAAMGFVDQVVVLTMTNGAAVAVLNPACKRMTIDRTAHVGADLTVLLPIPIIQTLLPGYTWKKEVWKAKQWLRVNPDIPMCRI